jgi:hypothetical protein
MRWDENSGGKIMLRYYAGCPKEEYGSDMKGMTVEMEFLVIVRGNKNQEEWLIYILAIPLCLLNISRFCRHLRHPSG